MGNKDGRDIARVPRATLGDTPTPVDRMGTPRMGRRAVLRAAATALAVPSLIPAGVLGAPGRPGANDRIRIGLIGAGFRARDLIVESPADLQLVAIADCDLRQISECLEAVGKADKSIVAQDCSRYQDYRQMLSQEKLDAVLVATTTHARTLVCLHAMQAGLDVYAEKPLTLTIEEGQHLVRAEKKFGSVCQVGTQQRSIAINNFGSDLVRSGAIGKVLTVQCPNFPGPRAASAACRPHPRRPKWTGNCGATRRSSPHSVRNCTRACTSGPAIANTAAG